MGSIRSILRALHLRTNLRQVARPQQRPVLPFLVGRVEILDAERPHDPANGSEQLGIGRLELPQAACVNLGTFPEADVTRAGPPFADAAVRASYGQHV